MPIFRTIRAALGTSATLAMLAGCSGGSSPAEFSPGGPSVGGQSVQRQIAFTGHPDNSVLPPSIARVSHEPIATASFMDPSAVDKPLIFVSDAADGVVNIYPQAGKHQKMVGQITGLKHSRRASTTMTKTATFTSQTPTARMSARVRATLYWAGVPKMTISDTHSEFPADVAVLPSTGTSSRSTNLLQCPEVPPRSTGNALWLYAKGEYEELRHTVFDSAFNFTRVMFAGSIKTWTARACSTSTA